MKRPLGELDLRVIAIDGIVFRDHTILIALGVTSSAEKVILGVHEGATENAGVVKALLRDLIERGLSTERVLLFVRPTRSSCEIDTALPSPSRGR